MTFYVKIKESAQLTYFLVTDFYETLQRHRFHEKNDFFQIFVNYLDLCAFDDEDDLKIDMKTGWFCNAIEFTEIYFSLHCCHVLVQVLKLFPEKKIKT